MSEQIKVFPDKDSLALAAADIFRHLARRADTQQRPFNVALAGGSTPKTLYTLLAHSPFLEEIQWQQIQLFFGDERCVPPTHEDSNYKMVETTLLAHNPNIPATNVYRIDTDQQDLHLAAQQYAEVLKTHLPLNNDGIPVFDLILLGMGPDGHTASLFPHKPALHVTDQLVVPTVPGLKPFVPRLTLTFPLLDAAQNVLFLVAGEDKADTLARVLEGSPDPDTLPSQSVRLNKQDANRNLIWLLDAAAASKLSLV